jgi:homoserine kinase type II
VPLGNASFTCLTFDLMDLMGWYCGHYSEAALDFATARRVIQEYESRRPLTANERRHLYDVAKLSVFVERVWGDFDGVDPADFTEKRIERLNALGREGFYERMLG